MDNTPKHDAAFVSAFEVLSAGRNEKRALMRPLYRDGVCFDVVMEAANPSWIETRSTEFHKGMLGSEIHSEFETVVLEDIRSALNNEVAHQVFEAEDTDKTRSAPKTAVTYRRLENGYVVVEARDLELNEELAEVMGPALIVDLPEGPFSVPTHFVATNEAFKEMFLTGVASQVPSLTSSRRDITTPLTFIRDHVTATFLNTNWEEFFTSTFDAYSGAGKRDGLPFVFESQGFIRSYHTRRTADGWVGVWLYRPAEASEIDSRPELAPARIEVLRSAVAGLDRPTAAHLPVFNEEGELVDISAVWANKRFDSYRVRETRRGDLGSENRVRFEEGLLPYLREAWETGSSAQIWRFEANDDVAHLYAPEYATHRDEFGVPLEIETMFYRTEDGYITEWGEDIVSKIAAGSSLSEQRRELEKKAAAAEAELAAINSAERFGRELHDNILQELFVVGLTLSPFEKEGSAPLPTDVVKATRESLARVTADIRALITNSKKSRAALIADRFNSLSDKWSAASDIKFNYTFESSIDSEQMERIPADVVDNTVYVAKEAIANAVKHSQADTLNFSVDVSKSSICVVVADNGVGIAEGVTRSSGTANMRKRAAAIDADLHVSTSSRGTSVILTAPFVIEAV